MRGLVAFALGVLSFPLFFFLGEGAGVPVMVPGMTAYFFVCQFMLLRGRGNGYREWHIMLALDAIPMLLLVLTAVIAEKWQAILVQGSLILGPACGGTFAGALAASLAARRRSA